MKTTKIQATSRISVKIKDTFYTFEYSEERLIEDNDNLAEVRDDLWQDCHGEVDKQVQEIYDLNKN